MLYFGELAKIERFLYVPHVHAFGIAEHEKDKVVICRVKIARINLTERL